MTDSPEQELARFAMIGVAATYCCRHCEARSEVRTDDSRFGWIVEHFHDRGCPDHEENMPAAESEAPDE